MDEIPSKCAVVSYCDLVFWCFVEGSALYDQGMLDCRQYYAFSVFFHILRCVLPSRGIVPIDLWADMWVFNFGPLIESRFEATH